jgi:acetoin utilization deacetylase AcuC-like enzyme
MGGNAVFCLLEGGVGHEGVDRNVTEVTIVLEQVNLGALSVCGTVG